MKATADHDLIEHTTHYECRVCGQTWVGRPKGKCPGLACYSRYTVPHLMTQTELGYVGYKVSSAALPPPVGCYRIPGNPGYILLYDPAHIGKRPAIRHRRTTVCLTEIGWPQGWCWILDDALSYRLEENSISARSAADIPGIGFHLMAFTVDETEAFAGPCLRLTIPPMMIPRSYPVFLAQFETRKLLRQAILGIYAHQYQKGSFDDVDA